MSIAGGFEKAIERGVRVGCQTIQIFTKSNNQWAAAPISDDQATKFRTAVKENGIHSVFAHDAYLINIGSPNPEIYEKSKKALKMEVERATVLGLAAVVMHPGAHMNSGEETAIAKIAKTVSWVLDQTKGSPVKVLYESAAGQGTAIGHTFEHLKALIAQTGSSDRVGICLDTCHMFAAGYDLCTAEAYRTTMEQFDRLVGISKIQAIHLNDSKKERGCRVDRHEHIGQGKMGLEAFRLLLNDRRLQDVPMVLETPKDDECTEDIMNLKTLRGLIAA